jgi:dienelactone hydrolase
VRAALRRAPVDERSLVVAGHSAGGALAADYAAGAEDAGLPPPVAVFAAYPGRRIGGLPGLVTERGPAPRGVEVVALAGARDEVVGSAFARRIARLGRGRLVRVADPAVADHLGPQRPGAAARRAFWAPLDRLIARARNVRR